MVTSGPHPKPGQASSMRTSGPGLQLPGASTTAMFRPECDHRHLGRDIAADPGTRLRAGIHRGRGPPRCLPVPRPRSQSCWHRRVIGERGASATAGQGRPCRAAPGITGGAGTGMSRYITQTAQASRRRAGSRGGSDETSDRADCAVLTKPEPAGADDPSHQNEHGGRNWRLCVRLICRNVQVPGVVGVGAAANSAARPRRGDSADAGMTRQPLPWGTSTMTPVPIRSWPRWAGSTLKPMPPMTGTTVRARRWSVRSC